MARKGAVHATARLANDAELRLAHLGLNLEAVPLAQEPEAVVGCSRTKIPPNPPVRLRRHQSVSEERAQDVTAAASVDGGRQCVAWCDFEAQELMQKPPPR